MCWFDRQTKPIATADNLMAVSLDFVTSFIMTSMPPQRETCLPSPGTSAQADVRVEQAGQLSTQVNAEMKQENTHSQKHTPSL